MNAEPPEANSGSEIDPDRPAPPNANLGSAPKARSEDAGDALSSAFAGSPFAGLFARIGLRRLLLTTVPILIAGGIVFGTSLFGILAGSGPDEGSGPGSTISIDTTTATPAPGRARTTRLHTTRGFEDFRTAVKGKFGSTRYVSAVIYPNYASIELPVDSKHSRRAYYDGAFPSTAPTTTRSPGAKSADLRDVYAAALVRKIRRAPKVLGVARPSTTYIVFDRRDGRPAMSVYVSGAGKSGYWSLTLDGTTITKYRSR